MKRKILRLTEPVTITGDPVFGRYKASVTLGPAQRNRPHSWILLDPSGPVSIEPKNMVSCVLQNMAVRVGKKTTAHVFEHLLPLKAAGLLGVMVRHSTHSLPYFGNTTPFLQAILPLCEEVEGEVPVRTVDRPYIWHYPEKRNGRSAFTSITPRHDGKLNLSITISYAGLGTHRMDFSFSGERREVEGIFRAKSQGYPLKRYTTSRTLSKLGLWKHHDHVCWPQNLDTAEALDLFTKHRALDLLGALGTLMDGHWLSADVTSVCSGHDADMHVCIEAARNLVPI